MSNTAEELTLRINGDSASGQAAVQSFVGSLDALKGKTENVGESLLEAFTHPLQAIEDLSGSLTSGLIPAFAGAELAVLGLAAGLAAAIPVAVAFAERAAEIGSHFQDMAMKTGMSVEAVSTLSPALQVAGSNIDSASNAMFMLERRMAEGSHQFTDGMARINLSVDDFKRMAPDQQFLAVADGLKHIEDPSQRAAAAMELFGRQGRDLLPTLMKLNEAMELTAGITPWSAEEARQAEEFEMQTKALKLQFEQLGVLLGREFLPAVSAVVGWFVEGVHQAGGFGDMLRDSVIPGYQTFTEWLGRGALAAETAGAKQDTINRAVEYGAPETIKYADAVKYLTEQFSYLHPQQVSATAEADKWLAKLTENATKALESAAAHAKLTEQLAEMGIVEGEQFDFGKEVLKEEEKRRHEKELYDKALRNILDVETGYKRLLEEISDDTVQAIFYDLEHKAAIEDIARVYDVTSTQVRILADAQKSHQKDEADALKEFDRQHAETFKLAQQHEKDWRTDQDKNLKDMNKSVLDTYNATRGYTNDYYDLVEKRTLSATEYEKAKIHEWEQKQLDAFHGTETQWQAYYDAVEKVTDEKLRAVEDKHNVLFQDVQKMLDEMAGADGNTGWGKHFSSVLVETGSFKDAFGAIWTDIKSAVKKILADMLSDFIDGYLGAASRSLGSWLGGLGGGGGSWWSSLLGFIPGFGGGDGGHAGQDGWTDGDGIFHPYPGNPTISFPTPEPGKDALGGIIPEHFWRGGFPGGPTGTDTVPIWATPGEGVLNTRAMANLGRENFNLMNAGARVSDLATDASRKVEVHVHVEGNVWALTDLTKAVSQQLADDFMQLGGLLPLDH